MAVCRSWILGMPPQGHQRRDCGLSLDLLPEVAGHKERGAFHPLLSDVAVAVAAEAVGCQHHRDLLQPLQQLLYRFERKMLAHGAAGTPVAGEAVACLMCGWPPLCSVAQRVCSQPLLVQVHQRPMVCCQEVQQSWSFQGRGFAAVELRVAPQMGLQQLQLRALKMRKVSNAP